jgi:glycosyltransferase involved in cell wall biosynthesis
MISIIVCSINKAYLEQVKQNIAFTIGAEHEIIAIDNTVNSIGICAVYNKAAAAAKYPYLCFLHEDVLFHSNGWGAIAAEILSDKGIGILGICGGVYKSQAPSAWIDIPRSHRRANMKWRDEKGALIDYINRTSEQSDLSETVTLDGLCLMMRKEVWQEYKFDEVNVKGFHYYDLDIALRVGKKYRLVVSHKISAEHLSLGNFGNAWIKETLLFHKRFYNQLPVSTGISSQAEKDYLESFSLKRFLEHCKDAGALHASLILLLLRNYPLVMMKNLIFCIRLVTR